MGLFNKLFGKKEFFAEAGVLYLPIEGEVIPLAEIGDGVFSAEIMGKGCGIRPADETVFAPSNGTVTLTADTKHAVGIQSDDGAELLIHVGIDTVDMRGDGFDMLVKAGQRVRRGQPLMRFNMHKIEAAGHPNVAAFLVTNTDDFSNVTVLTMGNARKLTAVIKTER